MNYDDLYDLTPRSLQNKIVGFNSFHKSLMMDGWEQSRLIIHSCFAPHSKRRMSPKELLPFPWDGKKARKVHRPSPEELDALLKKYKLRE